VSRRNRTSEKRKEQHHDRDHSHRGPPEEKQNGSVSGFRAATLSPLAPAALSPLAPKLVHEGNQIRQHASC
jgi:hypothetical protein